jgi:aminoglycoside phosphotransferase (APT) family kinase protein
MSVTAGRAAPLDAAGAGSYLVARGLVPTGAAVQARELGDGVSGVVLSVRAGERAFVIKQALPELRVADHWPANRERSLTEAAALGTLARLTPDAVPSVLDVDAAALAFTMDHAPAAWRNWKRVLLAGEVDPTVAARLGAVLAAWHAGTAGSRPVVARFGDQEVFDQLRIDAYHRTVAARRPELAPAIGALVARMAETRVCLVHGDFSPKNALVGDGGLWMLDCEVAHYGDPAFDVAFLLSHLTLKAIHRPELAPALEVAAGAFVDAYRAGVPPDLVGPTGHWIAHLGCLLAARADGKSPAEYLDPAGREAARALARRLLLEPPAGLPDVWRLL